jgi:hypothetical protein
MKKLLAILWLTVSFAHAQDQSTPNLITSGTTHTWTGASTGSMAMACPTNGGACSGGPGAMYDPSTNTIHFSYGQATVAQTFAINQALANAGSGIQVRGYSYSWDINNNNYDGRQGSTDILTATVKTMNYDNTEVRRTDTWTYNTRFNWTTFSGDVNYNNPGLPSEFGNLTVSFSGRDSGFWGGYFGPQVRNVNLRMRYGVDTCAADPLSSANCAGYAAAYLTLQCSGNPLYSPQCPGYAQAYFTQQCTVNALYDPSCPGYAAAYLNYQCSVNPLYATTCAGYETAYFNQQCSTNPLYNSRCPGYDQAYFAQQCNLNGLYATTCPNYSTAYAKKMLLEQQGLATTVATAGTVAKTAEVANAATTSTSTSDGSSSVAVAVVADPVVNQAVTSTATSTSPAAAATATVSLAPAAAPAADVKATATASAPPPPPAPMEKPAQPSARQQLAERRAEAAKKDAVEKGKNLANEMGKAADMESQKQVQNVVIQAMGFTPGFDTYGKVMVPDAVGYRPFTVYNNQKNVDNRRLGMGLYGPSERLHNDLVGSQYKE